MWSSPWPVRSSHVAGSGDIGVSLIVLAVVLPALVAQDYWRAMAFALHRPGVALANDAIFVAVQVAALATVLLLGARTAPWFLLAWGAGAAAGAVAGFVQFGVHPFRKGAGPLFSHNWPFSRWLMADFLTIFCADQTYLLLVAVLLGQAAFGELKAALSLMGPTAVILLTGGNLGLPTLSRARANDGLDGLVRVARKLDQARRCRRAHRTAPSCWWPVRGCSRSCTALSSPRPATWRASARCSTRSPSRRSVRASPSAWPARPARCGCPDSVVTALSIVAVIALSSWFGIVGAAWAGVFTVAAATAATLLVFRAYVTSERASERAGTRAAATDGLASAGPGDEASGTGSGPDRRPAVAAARHSSATDPGDPDTLSGGPSGRPSPRGRWAYVPPPGSAVASDVFRRGWRIGCGMLAWS